MNVQTNGWTKCESTHLIGRIHYIGDIANNKTTASTSYATQVVVGTATSQVSDILASSGRVITRTDLNAAGTVTAVIPFENHTMLVCIVLRWIRQY